MLTAAQERVLDFIRDHAPVRVGDLKELYEDIRVGAAIVHRLHEKGLVMYRLSRSQKSGWVLTVLGKEYYG